MTSTLSDWARAFLREDRVGVLGTLNADGSPHLTTMWYLLADDDTLILTTLSRNQKVKNLRRDPRMTFCVGDTTRSVSLSGHMTIHEDQAYDDGFLVAWSASLYLSLSRCTTRGPGNVSIL